MFMTTFENKLRNTDTANISKCLIFKQNNNKKQVNWNLLCSCSTSLGSVGRRMNVILFKWRGNVKMEEGVRTIKIVLGAALDFVS